MMEGTGTNTYTVFIRDIAGTHTPAFNVMGYLACMLFVSRIKDTSGKKIDATRDDFKHQVLGVSHVPHM